MHRNGSKNVIIALAFIALIICVCVGGFLGLVRDVLRNEANGSTDDSNYSYGKTIDDLARRVEYTTVENPTSAPLNAGQSLYDELPDITKYPLVVTGNADIVVEIASSGEKAGKHTDSWLVQVAESFNHQRNTTPSGKTIAISLRSVPSGTAADYIISGKYVPTLYTPSNELFGLYAIEQGANMELFKEKTVGNTAGLLVKKGSSYKTMAAIADGVAAGSYSLGYTNPQTSATGINLLVELLKYFGNGDMYNSAASTSFGSFNRNIPYVAYTTQQMRDAAGTGGLQGMVSEYQAYINDATLTSEFDFISFGQRHDNPLYICGYPDAETRTACETIYAYMQNSEWQNLATEYGFNKDLGYKNSYSTTGKEVTDALAIYKDNKDGGRNVIAMFVADCSGSMDGVPLHQLKSSVSNGMNYISATSKVGLMSYASTVQVDVPIAACDMTQKSYIQGALNNMAAGGNTHSYEAVVVAIKLVQEEMTKYPDAKGMVFLLSDGKANGRLSLYEIEDAVRDTGIPVYTIGYTAEADMTALASLSDINEAASISADTEDITYRIRGLFNAQL